MHVKDRRVWLLILNIKLPHIPRFLLDVMLITITVAKLSDCITEIQGLLVSITFVNSTKNCKGAEMWRQKNCFAFSYKGLLLL